MQSLIPDFVCLFVCFFVFCFVILPMFYFWKGTRHTQSRDLVLKTYSFPKMLGRKHKSKAKRKHKMHSAHQNRHDTKKCDKNERQSEISFHSTNGRSS